VQNSWYRARLRSVNAVTNHKARGSPGPFLFSRVFRGYPPWTHGLPHSGFFVRDPDSVLGIQVPLQLPFDTRQGVVERLHVPLQIVRNHKVDLPSR
jgi:hypothetical protein